jgi:hypothetical protein
MVHWSSKATLLCYQGFAIKTKATRITDTVKLFPTKTKIPYTTPTDVAIQTVHDLIQVVQQKQLSTAFAHIGTNQLEVIKQIAGIFNTHIKTQEPEKNKYEQPTSSLKTSEGANTNHANTSDGAHDRDQGTGTSIPYPKYHLTNTR